MTYRPAAMLYPLLALTFVGGGCASYRTETFDIEVVNATTRPVTISLAKTARGGPPEPYEVAWATPEDIAIEAPAAGEKWGMEVVPPGKSASVNGLQGKFSERTRAGFRAYWGAMTISEMLARSAESPDRIDEELKPGRNDIRLVDNNGRLGADLNRPAPATAPRRPIARRPMAYDQHIRDSAGDVARCAVLTLSDTRTEVTDKSGATIRRLVQAAGHAVAHYAILPDDPTRLATELEALLARDDLDAIFTNGGTGISSRDQTIDVVDRYLDVLLPGFGELFRMLSWEQVGSGAMLSRAVGGVADGKLLFAMPGSTPAVELAMSRLILPEMRHLLREIRK